MAVDESDGRPCWYELSTTDLAAAGGFYANLLGWSVADAGMPEFTYHLATATDGGMVAGLMSNEHQDDAPPPSWLIYFVCATADDRSAAMAEAGGGIVVPATDVPGTGRFAVCSDPQGAVFGVLQPERMEGEPPLEHPAFDQSAAGHGNWHELMSSDAGAAFDFYAGQFGWTKGQTMDMGDMGTYQIFASAGNDIGGMMGLGDAPMSAWMPYFGVDGGIDAAVDRLAAGGGSVHHGPAEVPGGGWIVVAQDPQGAWFGLVGTRD